MLTEIVCVTQYIKVTLDETKFTPEFFAEFNASIFDAGNDINAHFKYLAELYATGRNDEDDFIEGYGPARDMGIRLRPAFGIEIEIME